jgi:hypothetical protein
LTGGKIEVEYDENAFSLAETKKMGCLHYHQTMQRPPPDFHSIPTVEEKSYTLSVILTIF